MIRSRFDRVLRTLHAQPFAYACALSLILGAVTTTVHAHETPPLADGAPTLQQIMADPSWIATTPQAPRWSADGRFVYYETTRQGEDDTDLWRLEVATGETEAVADTDRGLVVPWVEAPEGRSGDRLVFVRDGDVFVHRVAGHSDRGAAQQLTRTAAMESRARFLTEAQVAFERGGQTYVRDLETGLESQPFDLRDGADPDAQLDLPRAQDSEAIAAEAAADGTEDGAAAAATDKDFFEEVQMRLFEVLQDDDARRRARRETDRERRAADGTRSRPPVYLGKGRERLWTELSPTTDAALVVAASAARDLGREDKMPVWVTEDGFVEIQDLRPKVGTGDGSGMELLLFVDGDEGVERQVIDLSTLPGIDQDPLARSEDEGAEGDAAGGEAAGSESAGSESAGDSIEAPLRAVTIDGLGWSPDGAYAVASIHSVDNKDRWLVALSPDDPEPRLIERLTLHSWINWRFNEFFFLPDGRLLFLSEATDRSQLYLWDPADGTTRRLTPDRGVVSQPEIARDGRHVLYVANTTDAPYRFDVYRVAIDGPFDEAAQAEQLTSLGGTINSYHPSPAGDRILWLQGAATRPPELFVQPTQPGARAQRLTATVSEAFGAVDWVEPVILGLPSSHQEQPLWARYYPPRNPDRLRGPDGSVPAVVFVHGAGYLHNAHAGWSVYFREMMFHTLLSEQGYAVLDMDYRGSAGYGATWRTAIYGHMGGPELEDLRDGVDWLVAERGVDRSRVGVYGGSYGGFLTLMALFQEPDLFASGAALRPVTDWAHYNHGYTSNILDTPDRRPEHYLRSSPIEFAEGLEKPLLICAPMLDDNVFFSDTVRLVQRLIELEKEDWELAVYPVEPHSFVRPSSWLDEYRRIFKLFEETLQPAP